MTKKRVVTLFLCRRLITTYFLLHISVMGQRSHASGSFSLRII